MTNIELIKKNNSEALRLRFGFKDKTKFSNEQEFRIFLLSFDLAAFLGVKANCNCIFHTDNKPSAKITKYNGVYFYRCFSENCDVNQTLNIIGTVMKLQNTGYFKALYFLKQVFNADVEINEHKDIETVLSVINKNVCIVRDIKDKAPNAFEIISKELRVLEALYEISLERPKTDKDGRPILSLSTRYLKEYLKKEIYVSKTLAILQYFNLLEKIPAYDCRNLDELIFVSRNNEVRDYTRVVTQIRILPLDVSVFDKLEKRADRFKKKKFLKSAFSFESVALKEDIFLANKLFPQK